MIQLKPRALWLPIDLLDPDLADPFRRGCEHVAVAAIGSFVTVRYALRVSGTSSAELFESYDIGLIPQPDPEPLQLRTEELGSVDVVADASEPVRESDPEALDRTAESDIDWPLMVGVPVVSLNRRPAGEPLFRYRLEFRDGPRPGSVGSEVER